MESEPRSTSRFVALNDITILQSDLQFTNPTQRKLAAASTSMRSIERQFINENLLMRSSPKVDELRKKIRRQYYTPGEQRDFTMKILKCDNLPTLEYIDTRRVVSLACLDDILDETACTDISFLEKYSSKIPLMCINAARLIYTTRAFVFRNRADWDNTTDALNFYLKIDSSYLENQYLSIGRREREPNLEFSKLLHCLRSSGYIEYIFELARHLKYHVELVLKESQNYVYVYKYTTEQVTYGVLTAFYNETQWYVYVSYNSIVRDKPNIIDLQ